VRRAGAAVSWADIPWTPAELLADPTPLAVLAAAGITHVRLGHVRTTSLADPRRLAPTVAAWCAQLAPLAAARGIRAVVQLHGGCFPHNATAAWACVSEADPAGLGVMLDPGNNVAQEGTEAFAYQVGLLGDRIAAIGVKDARHVSRTGDGPPVATRFVPLGEGENDWAAILTTLQRARGPVERIFMPFYTQLGDLRPHLAAEVALVRRILASS
jgi:sugar phosphate isomerase/epimerase